MTDARAISSKIMHAVGYNALQGSVDPLVGALSVHWRVRDGVRRPTDRAVESDVDEGGAYLAAWQALL